MTRYIDTETNGPIELSAHNLNRKLHPCLAVVMKIGDCTIGLTTGQTLDLVSALQETVDEFRASSTE